MGLFSLFPSWKRASREALADGFTLLEVIFAVAIFMFGITYASRNLIQSMNQKAGLNIRSAAYSLASGKIEEAAAAAEIDAREAGVHGNIKWSRELRESSIEGMSEVFVVVEWTESGRGNTFSLTTLVRDIK